MYNLKPLFLKKQTCLSAVLRSFIVFGFTCQPSSPQSQIWFTSVCSSPASLHLFLGFAILPIMHIRRYDTALSGDDVMLADCLCVCVFKREGVQQLIRTETYIYWLTASLVCITSASNALITAFYCRRWGVYSGWDSRDELDFVFAWFKVCYDISWCRLRARVL